MLNFTATFASVLAVVVFGVGGCFAAIGLTILLIIRGN
jgi:hypothetical protein